MRWAIREKFQSTAPTRDGTKGSRIGVAEWNRPWRRTRWVARDLLGFTYWHFGATGSRWLRCRPL